MLSLHFKVVGSELVPLFTRYSIRQAYGYMTLEEVIMTVDVFDLTIDRVALSHIANGLAEEQDHFRIKGMLNLPDITEIPVKKWGHYLHLAGRLWDHLGDDLERLSRRGPGLWGWVLQPNVDLARRLLDGKILELVKATSGVEKALLQPSVNLSFMIIAAQAASPSVWSSVRTQTSGDWVKKAEGFRKEKENGNCYIRVA